jgi:hypothetical protein
MKIAICFSGHLRNFYVNQLMQLHKNIELLTNNGHQVDCFFSIWDTYNSESSKYHHPDSNLVKLDKLDILNIKELEIENFNQVKHMFYLKDIHSTIQSECPTIISYDGILYSTPMFYKIYQCNALKTKFELKHNFNYDIVVRYRANINLLDPLNFDHVQKNLIYNCSGMEDNLSSRGLGYTHPSYMTQDMFFYGDSEIMDLVCSLYNELPRVISNHGSTGPERILYDWCFLENKLNHGVTPIKFDYDHI